VIPDCPICGGDAKQFTDQVAGCVDYENVRVRHFPECVLDSPNGPQYIIPHKWIALVGLLGRNFIDADLLQGNPSDNP